MFKQALITVSMLAGSFNQGFAANIQVTVSDLADTTGNVCVSVFDDPSQFPDIEGVTVFADCMDATNPVFNIDLELGTDYAFAMFHDQNENRALDTRGPLNIPVEGYGFSRDPAIIVGPPSWGDSVVNFSAGNQSLNIKARYIFQ